LVGGGAVEGHPGSAIAREDAIVDAGKFVMVVAGDEVVRGKTAAACHLGSLVVVVDFFVAGGADSIRIFKRGFGGKHRRGLMRPAGDAKERETV
jgi:hypothetical protein